MTLRLLYYHTEHGTVGEGWAAIRHALAHERVGIARYARCERLLSLLRAHFGDRWDDLPEAIRVWWARALVEVRAARVLSYRAIAAQAAQHRSRRSWPHRALGNARLVVYCLGNGAAQVLAQLAAAKYDFGFL